MFSIAVRNGQDAYTYPIAVRNGHDVCTYLQSETDRNRNCPSVFADRN